MSTPSNTELQALIDGATPGPWTARLDQGRATVEDANHEFLTSNAADGFNLAAGDARLIALTPDIAAELITVRTDRDRLRDGIKAMSEFWSKAANLYRTDLQGAIDAAGKAETYEAAANDLRALLDGEAKG